MHIHQVLIETKEIKLQSSPHSITAGHSRPRTARASARSPAMQNPKSFDRLSQLNTDIASSRYSELSMSASRSVYRLYLSCTPATRAWLLFGVLVDFLARVRSSEPCKVSILISMNLQYFCSANDCASASSHPLSLYSFRQP